MILTIANYILYVLVIVTFIIFIYEYIRTKYYDKKTIKNIENNYNKIFEQLEFCDFKDDIGHRLEKNADYVRLKKAIQRSIDDAK